MEDIPDYICCTESITLQTSECQNGLWRTICN